MLKNKVIYLLLFLLFINNHEYLFSQQMDQSEVLKDQKFSVSVDFPETINFHFEGESTKKIDDIKVEFITGDRKTLQDGFRIRRAATERKFPCFTSLDTAKAVFGDKVLEENLNVKSLDEYLSL